MSNKSNVSVIDSLKHNLGLEFSCERSVIDMTVGT